jgi:xylulokinase
MDIFLGFDVGTTSIKAVAVDGEGHMLASAQVPCVMETPQPGWFEIDAPIQWKNGFLKALGMLGRDVVSQAKALCVSSVCASFVPVDEAGEPLRNAIMYGIDTRAATQFERLNRSFPRERLADIAGNGFTSHSVLPKLLWLKENEPEIYARTARFVESSNYITAFLTGRYAWDRPSAAGGHMIDVRKGAYPSDFLKEIGVDEGKLPALRYPLEVLGTVTGKAEAATGLPAGTPVLTGACDVNAEAFACGAFDPGSLLLVYGSTLSTLYTIDTYKTLPGFLTGPSVLEGTYRLGGATSSGGRYLDWLRRLLGMEIASDRDGDCSPTAILMLPFLDGARIPYQDPSYRVLWYGMDSSTDRETLWKAAMESMGCELADLLRRFSSVGAVPDFAYVTGGLASNARFLQVAANVSGLRLLHFRNVNASFGDALMALSAVHGLENLRGILEGRRSDPANVELVEPDKALFEAYSEKRRRYRAAIESLDKW